MVAFGTAAPVALVRATVLHSNDCVHGGDTFSGILLVIALTCAVATVAMLGHLLLPAPARCGSLPRRPADRRGARGE